MWVIDGVRLNYISNQCPPKLVLLDLNDNGRVIHSYDFPDDVSSRNGGYLNDIVLDEHPDGDFAYITESSANPGLIVYSRKENKAWKLFDNSTMLYEVRAENFTVNGDVISHNFPIDGIALSQISDPERYVYYCALTGFALYRIPISVLKNYDFYENNEYRQYIEYVGDKQSQGDGMTIDNEGNLFYSLIPKHGIGRWNTRLNLDRSKIIEHNEELFDWPDSLGFDGTGSLYGTTVKHVYNMIDTSVQLHFDPDRIEYNVIKIFTGTKSYLYN